MRRVVVWRGLDALRVEIAHLDIDAGALTARGTQIGVAPEPYELRYELAAELLRAEIVGGPMREIRLEADFFDLGFSPLFNSLPILRHGLHMGGSAGDFVMDWVDVPSLDVSRSEQRYEPLEPGLVRFSAGTFAADIELDDEGLVLRYPQLCERVA